MKSYPQSHRTAVPGLNSLHLGQVIVAGVRIVATPVTGTSVHPVVLVDY
ncbi:MAG TPA: hypothetical protein VMQ86_05410 [Bryobacteraceae bacterium]|nr:hypothetical protein [Bryobacteraceae bacterium]